MNSRAGIAGVVLLAVLSAACGDDGAPPVPASMVVVGGAGQTGVVGTLLDSALQVQVLDAADRPVAGTAVAFAATPDAGSVDPASTTTDAQGIARSRWTLPSVAGERSVWARIAGVDSVQFTAVATAAAPASLILVSPDSQTALIGQPLTNPIVVHVQDGFGNPISGATLTFTPGSGAGTVTPPSAASDAAGNVSTVWTPPAIPGVYSVSATVDAAAPVVTTAIVFPPVPSQRLTVADSHGCWIPSTNPGPAYCWGENKRFQLGAGLATNSYTPVPVVGGLTFREISAGSYFSSWSHTCGVTVDSVAYCWGTIPTDTSALPESVGAPPPGKGFMSITTGGRHACALAIDGTAYCWGTNADGQLGDGTTVDRKNLTPVAGNIRFRQLSAGQSHTCGISTRGVLYCWGDNLNGQIDGVPYDDHLTPTAIATSHRFGTVRADDIHSCALSLDGGLYCWGNDGRGEVTTGPGGSPVPVPPTLVPGIGTPHAFALGYERTCIINGGVASCWGRNYEFGLGDSSYGERHTPSAVLGGLEFDAIDGGFWATCGITVANVLYCWGTNYAGAVGQPDSTIVLEPAGIVAGPTFTQISTGLMHTCGLDATGTAYCWGYHQWGMVGDGTWHPRATPAPVAGGLTFSTVSAGGYSACGVTTAGRGYCWGMGNAGQIGDGESLDRAVPTPITGSLDLANISVGFGEACALTTTGEAWCWGNYDYPPKPLPRLVVSPEPFVQVSAGTRKNCGLGVSGATYCWYPWSDPMTAVPVGGGHTFARVVTGSQFACGLEASGTAYCWGLNAAGALGNDAGLDQPEPYPVSGGLVFSSINVSSDAPTSCGISGGVAYCWGDNQAGQLGIGENGGGSSRSTPTAVNGGLQFATIDPSWTHTCALTSSGTAYCWGNGQYGALGTGATQAHPFPLPVRGQ